MLHAVNLVLSVVTGYLWQDLGDEGPHVKLNNLPFPAAAALIAPIYLAGAGLVYLPVGTTRLLRPGSGKIRNLELRMRVLARFSLTSLVALVIGLYLREAVERERNQPTGG